VRRVHQGTQASAQLVQRTWQPASLLIDLSVCLCVSQLHVLTRHCCSCCASVACALFPKPKPHFSVLTRDPVLPEVSDQLPVLSACQQGC
jgi:hypothetical protein